MSLPRVERKTRHKLWRGLGTTPQVLAEIRERKFASGRSYSEGGA